jgi:hypothetical protein
MLALSLATAGVAAAATPEFKPVPTKKKFKGTGKALAIYSGKQVFYCPKGTASGEISGGRNLAGVVLTWTGCESSANEGETKCPVNSIGAEPGEIVTKTITGELGTVAAKEATSGVGALLKPKVGKGWWELEGNHCTIGAQWEGTLAPEITVVGKKQTTNDLILARDPGIATITLDSGIQAHPQFEFFGEGVRPETVFELTFEEPIEVT